MKEFRPTIGSHPRTHHLGNLSTGANETPDKSAPFGLPWAGGEEADRRGGGSLAPNIVEEIAAAIAFALLVIALPFLPEIALLIADAIKS